MSSTELTAEDAAGPGEGATRREWLGLAALLLPALVLGTDVSVLFFALPSLSADLGPSPSQALWISHIYGFFIAGFLITMGRLVDRFGARRLVLTGTVAFAVLSAAAAYATGPEMLIVTRALLGIAGASIMPAIYALLRTMFADDGQRRFAIAALFSAAAVGGAIGPLVGGALLELFWWGSVFLVNVPVLLVLVPVFRLLLPEHREERPDRLDPASVALSLAAMLGIVYGLQGVATQQESTDPAPLWPYLAIVAGGAALAVWFVRRQRQLPNPLLDLTLFRNRVFSVSLLTLLLTGVGFVGAFYLFTQYLQWVAGLSPLRAGLWTLPYVVSNIVGGLLAPAFARRARPVTVIVLGHLGTALGLAVVAFLAGSAQHPVTVSAVALAVAGVGHGAAMALTSDLIISGVPGERAGSAGATQEVSGELGAALGIAAGGTIGILAYRASLGDSVPSDVPPAAAEAARAGVNEGIKAAETHTALLEPVQEAFTRGLQAHSGIAAALTLAAAGLVVVVFRGSRSAPSAD